MRLRSIFLSTICAMPGVWLAVGWAQPAKPPAKPAAKPAAPSASQEGNVIIRGTNSDYDDTSGIARLTKDVTVVQTGEDFILYAQTLTYNRPKNQAVATGNLRVETRDSTIRSARIFADFNTKIITFTGDVTINTHGKSGIVGKKGFRAEAQKKPSKILCERADWDYEARQATLTGNLRMSQGENFGTCERILFDENLNVAQLQGRVRFTDKEKRVFNTPDLTIYIDEGRIVTGRVRIDSDAKNPPGSTPRPAKTPILKVKPAPRISDEDLKLFDITPPPIPTPRPEPTEASTPPPASEENEEISPPTTPTQQPLAANSD
ncbi:MAG TPA: LptA/OstA family protein [Abditibacterium sp.]|jgi:lipopolysaccharide export system protein LptA